MPRRLCVLLGLGGEGGRRVFSTARASPQPSPPPSDSLAQHPLSTGTGYLYPMPVVTAIETVPVSPTIEMSYVLLHPAGSSRGVTSCPEKIPLIFHRRQFWRPGKREYPPRRDPVCVRSG